MQKIEINPYHLSINPHFLFDKQTLLLASGDFESGDFNEMTIGWGSIGTMWNKPFVQVVVRPSRYTLHFMQEYPDFTVSASSRLRKHSTFLAPLGSRWQKLPLTNLTVIASQKVKSPSFEEAELSLECKTIYSNEFDPVNFIDPSIKDLYPDKDYHFVFYGEIVHAVGVEKYRSII